MSYAQYSTTDRWRWVDGCVHEHVRILNDMARIMLSTLLVGSKRIHSEEQVLQSEHHHDLGGNGFTIWVLEYVGLVSQLPLRCYVFIHR